MDDILLGVSFFLSVLLAIFLPDIIDWLWP